MQTTTDLFNKKEALNPELEACFDKDGSIPMIRHPLVFSLFHNDSLNALMNAQLAFKKEALAEALNTNDYHTFVFMHERPYRLEAFMKLDYKAMDDKTYWELLKSIWMDSENIFQNKHYWKELLTYRGPYSRYQYFMDAKEKVVYDRFSQYKVHAVYRGYQRGLNPKGFSYTLDKAKAKWFSKRLARNNAESVVKQRFVKKDQVIAYLEGRGESEVIIIDKY